MMMMMMLKTRSMSWSAPSDVHIWYTTYTQHFRINTLKPLTCISVNISDVLQTRDIQLNTRPHFWVLPISPKHYHETVFDLAYETQRCSMVRLQNVLQLLQNQTEAPRSTISCA